MSIIFKPLFEILTGDVAICDHWLYNYIALGLVNQLAYQLSYDAVGDLYRSHAIDGRAIGSTLHWIIRLPTFFVSAYLLRFILWIYDYAVLVPVQVWWVLLGLFIVGIVTLIVVCNRRRHFK